MNRIKQLRKDLGIKQSDFAREFNVSQGTLSNWERGVHDPDAESLKKMRDRFNKTSDYILGLSNDPMTQDNKLKWSDLDVSFYEGIDLLTDDEKKEILGYINFKVSGREKIKDK